MKEFKQNLVDLIVSASHDLKIISLREIADANGINHIARQDTQDILRAVCKALPGYRPVQIHLHEHESLFTSLCFVQNDVTFDDGEGYEDRHIYLIESIKNGDSFGGEAPLTARDGRGLTESEAVDFAELSWSRLSDYDRARRSEFFVCEAPEDECGCCDLDRARVIKEFC